ncbi:MAG: hypothetical protein RLN76_06965 [Phycisphaeraceae bacterium]
MNQQTSPLDPVLEVHQSIDIDATAEAAFDAVLEEFGPLSTGDDGRSMNLKIEPWPGGRWYRDLGHDNGHLWGFVQVIKRPMLLELCGPMFMSGAALNHVQIRITPREPAGVALTLLHRGVGMIAQPFIEGTQRGWRESIERIKQISETSGVA